MIESALYLIPVNISDAPLSDVLPDGNTAIISELQHFVVENVRTARRFLRKLMPGCDIDSMTFHELNGHTDQTRISEYLQPLREGKAMGVMSEAGCPAIADPGAQVVEIAQREGFRVVPLVGPSSILMALMGSGFNGQGFTFNGYLPIQSDQRVKKIKELESLSAKTGHTQIFIETPYRNGKMLETLLTTLRPSTMLCVACDITSRERESIVTLPVGKWNTHKENYDKRPALFLIHSCHTAK